MHALYYIILSTSLKTHVVIGQKKIWYDLKALDKLDRKLCLIIYHVDSKTTELKVAQY